MSEGEGEDDDDRAKREAFERFVGSEAGAEFSLRCLLAGCRSDVTVGGIARSADCLPFFEWVVRQSRAGCLVNTGVMSPVLEGTEMGKVKGNLMERECREFRFMRLLVAEISHIFFVKRLGTGMAKRWFLASKVDWHRVKKMIEVCEFNLWHPRLCEFLRSVVLDGDVQRCPSCEIPSCFLGVLCHYADVPITVVRAYCKRNKELVRQHDDGSSPFLDFSGVIESQHRYGTHGAPASIYRRQHDRKLRRLSSRFAAEDEVFSFLLDDFRSGSEWSNDPSVDDYGQPSCNEEVSGSNVSYNELSGRRKKARLK